MENNFSIKKGTPLHDQIMLEAERLNEVREKILILMKSAGYDGPSPSARAFLYNLISDYAENYPLDDESAISEFANFYKLISEIERNNREKYPSTH